MELKLCHLATHGRHWTPLGVAGAAVSNLFAPDTVLLGCEQEADKVGLSEHVVGRCRSVVELLYNEELNVLESERVMDSVGTALSVFAWAEEEKKGKPDEIADGDVSCGGSLGGSIQGLDNADMERPHSCWRRILLLIGCQLASQAKVKLP